MSKHAYCWNLETGKMEPFEFPAQETASHETASQGTWQDHLDATMDELYEWLHDARNIFDALDAVEDTLKQKHHDYGESNLQAFGELGILVRASDKVARLKTLIEKKGEVKDETREDTWRDLAGYAIQALIMMKQQNSTSEVDLYEIRKNRLNRGICPDCGEGALIRKNAFDNRLQCSVDCGFIVMDIYSLYNDFSDFSQVIDMLAEQKAYTKQK